MRIAGGMIEVDKSCVAPVTVKPAGSEKHGVLPRAMEHKVGTQVEPEGVMLVFDGIETEKCPLISRSPWIVCDEENGDPFQ
jgi:hypothetical protein